MYSRPESVFLNKVYYFVMLQPVTNVLNILSDAQIFFHCKVHCGEQPNDSTSGTLNVTVTLQKHCGFMVQK